MSLSPRRIVDAEAGARPLAAWLAGLAMAMLTLGCYGALHPLLPPPPLAMAAADDSAPISEFQSPDEAPPPDAAEATETPPKQDIEIPPIPEITPPLTPPEVPELLPVDTPPPPKVKPPELKPKPRSEPKPMAHRSAPGSTGSKTNGSGNSGTPTVFSGGGDGYFPKGGYPASARSMKQQGTVRLLVTVEASGLPSSVQVQSSSGFGSLDSGALDQVRRHWRWPAGAIRRFIVPFRFELH